MVVPWMVAIGNHEVDWGVYNDSTNNYSSLYNGTDSHGECGMCVVYHTAHPVADLAHLGLTTLASTCPAFPRSPVPQRCPPSTRSITTASVRSHSLQVSPYLCVCVRVCVHVQGSSSACGFPCCSPTAEYGPVHFTLMSTEHNFSVGSDQYEWIVKDLASVDRSRTPWLIVGAHFHRGCVCHVCGGAACASPSH